MPSDVVWAGPTPSAQPPSLAWRGQALAYVPYQDFDKAFANFATGDVLMRRPQDKRRAAHLERMAAARIPVELIAAPVLVAGAHDDQV